MNPIEHGDFPASYVIVYQGASCLKGCLTITNSSGQWPSADVVSFGALGDAMARAQQWEIALDVLQVGWFPGVTPPEI